MLINLVETNALRVFLIDLQYNVIIVIKDVNIVHRGVR